ncbi:hypothetical protein MKX01_010509 [Papaver californicum]|nr:hypothetical protein MKX01_030223 [Papaver californicum]KAI3957063.1 hypothetical protein MKX01_010509 [Papaver californicum]
MMVMDIVNNAQVVQSLMEKLRPLVGLQGGGGCWDYCVLWKLMWAEDHTPPPHLHHHLDQSCCRFIEWVSCCCGGAGADVDKNISITGEAEHLMFPVSDHHHQRHPCRDLMFQHLRTKNCDLLAKLPSTIPLMDSEDHGTGVYAHSLISNQPTWITNVPNCSIQLSPSSFSSEETIGTRVLIPVPGGGGGLIEFFVAKHVSEDPQLIEFVMTHCNLSWEEQQQETAIMLMNTNSATYQHDHYHLLNHQHRQPIADDDGRFQQNVSSGNDNYDDNGLTNPTAMSNINNFSNSNLPWDLSVDRIHLTSSSSSSPLNFFRCGLSSSGTQHLEQVDGNAVLDSSIMDDKAHHNISGFADIINVPLLQETLMNNVDATNLHFGASANNNIEYSMSSLMATTTPIKGSPTNHPATMGKAGTDNRNSENKPVGLETGRADSLLSGCSNDRIIEGEDEDDNNTTNNQDGGGGGRSSAGSGRPHQSKNLVAERKRRKSSMDRAAILGDAIEYVQELQKQVKDLQDELEDQPSGDHDQLQDDYNDRRKNNKQQQISSCLQLQFDHRQNGTSSWPTANDQYQHDHQNGAATGTKIGLADNDHQHQQYLAGTTTARCSSIGTSNNNNSNIVINCSQQPLNNNQQSSSTPTWDDSHGDDKQMQQMEPQVEVNQIERNEFFLKVLCEHKPGGFGRLMEAMNSLGLEVTNANVTTFRSLVLNVFKVEKRDNDEMVQADHVRDSLLEITRDRMMGGWSKQTVDNQVGLDINSNYDHDQHHHHDHGYGCHPISLLHHHHQE